MSPVAVACAVVAGAFVLGSIPFGVIVSRLFFGRDIRAHGSANIGAANALRTLGKGAGAGVLLLDALKGAVPVLVAQRLGAPPEVGALGAIAAVIGHCYSPLLGGKGGKGVATSYGAIWALAWPAGLTFTFVWLAVVIACGFASAASMLASAAMPFTLWFAIGRPGLIYGLASAVFIIAKHRDNLVRLRNGTENPLGLFAKRRISR